jgi:Uma2 family endonuclease
MSTAEILRPITPLDDRDPADHDHYEIVDGFHVELPPMSVDSQVLACRLTWHLTGFGLEHRVGCAYTEILFKLPLPVNRNRRPDVAFVPYTRWPLDRPFPSTNGWDVLPDLCVEVVSPTDMADEIMDKLREYFQAGVRLVWVFYPRHQVVHIYDSLTTVRGQGRNDTLDGGVVLPGFQLALAELFPLPPTPPA